jgi:GWxTD domain-containing protein
MKPIKHLLKEAAALFATAVAMAAGQPQAVRLNADYACFRYDDKAVFTEVYYSVKGAPQASMRLVVTRNDSAYTENAWAHSGGDSLREGDTVLGRVFFVAPEGNYRWSLTARDGDSSLRCDSVVFQKTISPFGEHKLQLSDIEIASSIQFASETSASNPFYKNSMIVVPNPALQAGLGQNLIYFYIELYNILDGVPGGQYGTRVSILDEAQAPLEGTRPISRKKKKTVNSTADFGEVGLFGVGPGKYHLSYGVLDSAGRVLSERRKTFWVARPSHATGAAPDLKPEAQFEISPFAAMDETAMKQEFECARYLMTDQQRKLWSSIKNTDSRRRWIYDFWIKAPAVHGVNFEEYHKRIDEADAQYGTFQMAGWKTDRGRIFITLGKPNDIERFPSSSQAVPYEIWRYDAIEGGVIFVFADLSGFKNYSLLHSTKRGEVYNSEYETQLRSGY